MICIRLGWGSENTNVVWSFAVFWNRRFKRFKISSFHSCSSTVYKQEEGAVFGRWCLVLGGSYEPETSVNKHFFCPQGWMILSSSFLFSMESVSLHTWHFRLIDKDLQGKLLAARFSLESRHNKVQCHKHQHYFTMSILIN